MPSLPSFDTCCGCIELRTGCLIIGYLSLIGDVLTLIIFGVFGLVGGSNLVIMGPIEANVAQAQQTSGAIFLAVIIVILSVLSMIISIVLLIGLHQNIRRHVKFYLIAATVSYTLLLVFELASIGYTGPQTIISHVIAFLINVYFLLVIRSYFYKMDDSNQKPVICTSA